MKNKVIKIIFILSFLPYILILISGISVAFSGVSIFSNTVYGINAFLIYISLIFSNFKIMIPIVFVCFFYQICYIFRKKIKFFKKMSAKKYIGSCCIIGGILLFILIVFFYSFELEKLGEKLSAKQMIKKADEEIGFNKGSITPYGIFDLDDYKNDHIFIDYDKKEIGILMGVGAIDEFWKVKLQKTTKDSEEYQHIANDYFMQADIPLSFPGKRLVSFYEAENCEHRTIAFLLLYEDGSVYFADNITEPDSDFSRYTGLNCEYFVGEDVKFSE